MYSRAILFKGKKTRSNLFLFKPGEQGIKKNPSEMFLMLIFSVNAMTIWCCTVWLLLLSQNWEKLQVFGQDLLLEDALHRQNLNNICLSTSFPLHRLLNRWNCNSNIFSKVFLHFVFLYLTHFQPVFHFSTPWTHQKICLCSSLSNSV